MSTTPAIDEQVVEQVETILLPVPDNARTSTAGHQFWIWSGANIAPINWVLGSLGIEIGLSLSQTILVLVIGNIIGMAAFGFFVLMGQRTGVSQMVMARSAFGRRGAYLPAAIQGLISAGWCAVNTWIVLDLVLALIGKLGYHGGTNLKIVIVLLVMGLQIWLAARGFKSIAKFERYTVPVTFCVLIVMTIVAWSKNSVHWGYAGAHLHGWALLSAESTIMTAIGIGWGCTWFAYASDYSRFLPRAMSRSKVFFASVFGQFLPVVWLGIFGATLATVTQKVDPGALVVSNFGILAIPVLLLVLHGPIATNILNIYSCSLCAQTLDWKLNRRKIALLVGAIALGVHHRPRLPEQLRQHLGQLAVGTGDVDRPVGGRDIDPLLLLRVAKKSMWTCCTTRLGIPGSPMCVGQRSSPLSWVPSPLGASSTARSVG